MKSLALVVCLPGKEIKYEEKSSSEGEEKNYAHMYDFHLFFFFFFFLLYMNGREIYCKIKEKKYKKHLLFVSNRKIKMHM